MWAKGVSRNMAITTVAPATVTTTAARITAEQVQDNDGANQGVTLQADPGNASNVIYIGDSTVTTSNGIALAAGASYTIPIWDPHTVFAVASGGTPTLRISFV